MKQEEIILGFMQNALNIASFPLSTLACSAETSNWFDLHGKALKHDDLLFSTVVPLIARMHLSQEAMPAEISFPQPQPCG